MCACACACACAGLLGIEFGELGELVPQHRVAELGHVWEVSHRQLVRTVHLEEVVLEAAEQLGLGLLLTW